MKNIKALILLIFLSFSTFLFASTATQTQTLKWEIQTWMAGNVTRDVMAFENAAYPDDSYLPYFQTTINTDNPNDASIKVSLVNTQFEEVTPQEKEIILNSGKYIPSDIAIKVIESCAKRKNDILFLPIIFSDGSYKKLASFDLIITHDRQESSMKAKSANVNISSTKHTFAPASVMNTGKWVKIQTSATGIYKVTHKQIVAKGLNPNDIHVFGYGAAMLQEDFSLDRTDDLPQIAIYIEKGNDGIFNDGDYILFYAQGPISWEYLDVYEEFEHTINPYSEYGYYFLASGVSGVQEKLIQQQPVVDTGGKTPTEITSFIGYELHEKDLVNLISSSGKGGSGREFYGEEFSSISSTQTITFNIPNLKTGSKTAFTIDAAIYSPTSTNSPKSNFKIDMTGFSSTFNAENISGNFHIKAKTLNRAFTFNPTSASFNVKLTFNPSSGATSSARGWLNYIRITAQRELIMVGKEMIFSNAGFSTEKLTKYILRGANNNIKIWETTDQFSIKEIKTDFNSSTGELTFVIDNTAKIYREFVALDMTNSFKSIEKLEDVPNQNLHANLNHELVIVCHPDYWSEAEKLKKAHEDIDHMSVLIVTPEQVYNEFSSGTPDPTAIRWFMKMFYERKNNGTSSQTTKYLLLFGDGSYDNRQIVKPADNNNKIITFQSYNSVEETSSYVTDDYFAFLDDSEGRNFNSDGMDIGVGRFPVNTLSEATGAVNKTISYMNNKNKGSWKNQLCFVADDADDSNDVAHTSDADALAQKMTGLYPDFQINKIYLDAYTQVTTANGESYPEAREALLDQIKKGAMIVNYTGHGGTGGWASEKILQNQDIAGMHNDNMALWITATCDFSRFDSGQLTAGENAFLNPKGGAVALLTTTRTVYAINNSRLNLAFADYLFEKDENGLRLKLGDICKKAKGNSLVKYDANKLNFTLLGDPALTLAYPAYNVTTDLINNEDANNSEITLKALDKVEIQGSITDDNNNILSNFNGKISIGIFDKEKSIRLLNNNGYTENITFKDRSIISLAEAKVVDGKFTTIVMIPKDINYTLGNGRIVYYAQDENNDNEAHGHFEDFIIGGSNDDNIDDNEGPQINMYLNTPSFSSGDKVSNSPLFVANVADENGINITGSGIGHDIMLILDNKDWINLNRYFEAELGTYERGTVTYKLQDLPDGKHTITFRVWDLLNNSSTDSFDFEVGSALPLKMEEVYCYPNPAYTSTVFALKHDRPDEEIDVTIRVYDMAGRELWNFNSDFYTTTDNTLLITDWDLKTASGQRLRNGMYLFKVEVASSSGKISTKTKKIIVNAQ